MKLGIPRYRLLVGAFVLVTASSPSHVFADENPALLIRNFIHNSDSCKPILAHPEVEMRFHGRYAFSSTFYGVKLNIVDDADKIRTVVTTDWSSGSGGTVIWNMEADSTYVGYRQDLGNWDYLPAGCMLHVKQMRWVLDQATRAPSKSRTDEQNQALECVKRVTDIIYSVCKQKDDRNLGRTD
jgi:hypothetical protein